MKSLLLILISTTNLFWTQLFNAVDFAWELTVTDEVSAKEELLHIATIKRFGAHVTSFTFFCSITKRC